MHHKLYDSGLETARPGDNIPKAIQFYLSLFKRFSACVRACAYIRILVEDWYKNTPPSPLVLLQRNQYSIGQETRALSCAVVISL